MPSTMAAAASGTRGSAACEASTRPGVDSKTRRATVLSLLLRGRMGPEERAVLLRSPCGLGLRSPCHAATHRVTRTHTHRLVARRRSHLVSVVS